MQLKLIFPTTRQPHAELWTALDEKARRTVLERLTNLISENAPDFAPATRGGAPVAGCASVYYVFIPRKHGLRFR